MKNVGKLLTDQIPVLSPIQHVEAVTIADADQNVCVLTNVCCMVTYANGSFWGRFLPPLVCLKNDAARITKHDKEMFHDES